MARTINRSIHRWQLLMAALVMLLFSIVAASRAQAAIGDKYSINIQGTMNYTKSWELLSNINELREDDKKLGMDDSLMVSAMQRAAEISCFFNNELRPNQTAALSINEKAKSSLIIRGVESVEEVGKALKENAEAAERIKNTSFQSVGIGCFYVSSTYYWVLLFGEETGSPKVHEDAVRTVTIAVTDLGPMNTASLYVEGNKTTELSMYTRQQAVAAAIWQDATGSVANAVSIPVAASSFTWTSSDSTVATVSDTGLITAKAAGTSTITAMPKVKDGTVDGLSLTVTVAEKTFTAELKKTLYTYTGKAIKPAVVVKEGDTVLTSGTDYKVKYKYNTNAGLGKVTVTGKGDYKGIRQVLRFRIRPGKMTSLKLYSTKKGRLQMRWNSNSQAISS